MIINDIKLYSGELIHTRLAYKYFREKVLATGNIISFRAPMEVTTNLIDLEDSLNQDFIYSQDAVNFCWEIPNLCPVGAVAFQRLFNTQIALILEQYIKAPILMKGDDLMVQKEHNQGGIVQKSGKCSVSITVSRNNVALGHTGINVIAGKRAPAFAFSTNLPDSDVIDFQTRVIEMFYNLTDDLFVSSVKVS